MTSLVFLVPILVTVTASPLHQHRQQQQQQQTTTTSVDRLSRQNEPALPLSSERLTSRDVEEDRERNEQSRGYVQRDVLAEDEYTGGTRMLSALLNRYQRDGLKNSDREEEKDKENEKEENKETKDTEEDGKDGEKFEEDRSKGKLSKKGGRKHKAIFVDYRPFVSRLRQSSYSSLPRYDLGYNDIYQEDEENQDVEGRRGGTSMVGGSNENYQEESNIFYIRLPPTPYMFVPGLGYISQPPTYSTASLRPQIPHSRPTKPQLTSVASTSSSSTNPHQRYHQKQQQQQQQQQQTWTYHQRPNPFIKLPIDFVSNGKPTSVYHWQKKKPTNPSKLPVPADSPITNLDDLTPGFVSNGKPTTIYQWHTNLKPAKRPDDELNILDNGPYLFNGKPTSLYLLKPDGTSTDPRPIRYHDFENDNSYY